MADRDTDILLIGGGIASATAAATLREAGFDGSTLLVGRELDPSYRRLLYRLRGRRVAEGARQA